MNKQQFDILVEMIEAIVEDYEYDDAHSAGKKFRSVEAARKILVNQEEENAQLT